MAKAAMYGMIGALTLTFGTVVIPTENFIRQSDKQVQESIIPSVSGEANAKEALSTEQISGTDKVINTEYTCPHTDGNHTSDCPYWDGSQENACPHTDGNHTSDCPYWDGSQENACPHTDGNHTSDCPYWDGSQGGSYVDENQNGVCDWNEQGNSGGNGNATAGGHHGGGHHGGGHHGW